MADWDSVWDSVQQEREQRLRAAFAAKPPVQPEAAARANQLSDRLGQPFDVVAANLDEFEQDDRAAHVLEVGRKNPVVGEFLQDPRRAALASDDVDALDRLAGLFSGAVATPLTGMNPLASGLIRPLLEQMGVGARRGAARSEFGETFQREAAATGASAWHAVADFLDQTTQRPAREIFGALATAAEGTDQAAPARALAEGLADPLGVAGQAAQSAAVAGEIEADRAEQAERIGGRPSLDLLRRDPGAWAEQAAAYYANQGTASLPVMLLAIASRRPWLGGGLMGASEGAGTYTELRGEGMDRLTAAGAGAGTGALEAGLGAVGLGAAMRPGLAGMLGGPLIEAGTEGLTTAGQIEVLDFARGQRTDPVEKLMATWDAVVLGLGFGAIERAGSAALDAMTPQQRAETALEDGLRVQRSAASAAQLGAALDAVAASKLAERSEPDLRAFLQQSGASGNVYISAEQATTLFQSEVLADMVGGAEALEVQLASGDVAIPADVFLARAARMPNVDEIKRHIRARAEDVSLAEVEAIDFDALAQQFGLEDTTEAAERAEPGTVDAREQVVQDVMGQLIATNRYTPAAAEAQAKLWGAAMDRLATMAGTDAWSLYQRYMGGIRSGRADGTDPLATRPWQGDGRLDALLDSIRSPQETSQREIRGPSLVEFLRANGGIRDEGGELRGMDAARQRPGLINSAGMPLDRAREIVAEAGYFGDDTGESIGTTTISDLLDLIDRDLRSGDVFSVREGDRARQEFEADRDRLLAAIDEHPVLSSMPQEEFRALTNQQIADMLFGGSMMDQGEPGSFDNPFPESEMESAPVGAWVAGPALPGLDTRRQIMDVPLDRIDPTEFDSAGQLAPEKRADAARYAEAMARGEQFPNGRGSELENGLIKLQDGHRRYWAARESGATTLRLAVSPLTLNQPANFEQPAIPAAERDAQQQFDESSFRPAVVSWAKETYGDAIAPNGRPVWQNFVAWFGDSQAVDSAGAPLVVYHGTGSEFSIFSEDLADEAGVAGKGFYFTSSRDEASSYAERGDTPNVIAAYVSISNPLVIRAGRLPDGRSVIDVHRQYAPVTNKKGADEIRSIAEQNNNDGVIWLGNDGSVRHVVAFRPEQIKSATANRGTFDPSNPSILYQSARVDEATGLPLNDDGTVTVYHHTSAEAAEAIRRSGVLRSAAEPDVYVTTRRETDIGYGDVAVPIRVNPGLLQLDDEFPGGRMDFRLDVGRPGGSIRVKVDEPAGSGEPRSLFQRVADAALGLFNQRPSPKGPRGQIQIFPDRRMSISLFETADRSTFLHESGHFFLEVFRDIAADPNASQQAKDDFETLLQWFGVESADQIQREHHEQFARGFEAYLMEGKAPSPDLRSVFASFKAWLVSIYRTLASLNVTLSDDVRGVMDRLLATEDEIEAAQVRQGFEPMALPTGEAGQIGLTEKQLADYAAMIEAATEEARAEVTAKLMAAHDRARRRWYKEELAAVRAEVEAEFGSQPVHRAARVLAGGRTYADGTPVPENLQGLKLDRAALVDVYGEAYLSRLRGLYAKEGGTDQDAAAMALGFPSGDALVVALANRGDLQARVEAETQARMRERHGDPMTDGTLAEVAMDAVHNDARVRLLQRELDMLADLGGNPRLDARLLTGIARNRMAQTALRDIRPNDYLVAERKAARKATAAAAQGDYAEALQAKRQQALNAALYREARKAQERAAKTTTYLRKAASDKTRKRVGKTAGKHYVDALDAIFAGIEVRGVSRPEVARRASLREWVRRMQEEGSNTAVPEDLLARVESERVTNLADMTVAEVEGLREAVENLLHLARTKNKLLTAKGQRDWEEAKAELIARLEQQEGIYGRTGLSDADRAAWDRVREFYAKGANWVLQPETLIEWLDGGTSGPFHDLLWEPSEAAEHTRERLNRMVGEKLQAAMAALPAADRKALDRRYRIESLDADISGHSILSALLNMGNAGNRDKLLRGGRVVGDEIVPFTPEQLAEMFSKLSKPQAELVQGIWDAVDLLWPEIVAMEERLNGIAPERVVATPFTVMTKDGPVALRGGYYPVMYDPSGARAGQFAEDEQAKRVLSGQTPVRATTSKGHTEARTDYVAPLLLDYHSVLTRHLDGVTGDIAWRQFLAQAYKVLGDADIRRMINNRIGPGAANGLQKAFERGATGNFSLAGPLFGPFQKVADATMTNLSSAALGFRVPLALANVVTAPILATARVKKRFLLKGFFDYYGGGPNIIANMRNNARAIHALSPMMLRRSEARSIELSAIIANLRGKRGFRAKMIELAMAVHQWIVPLAENAIWMAAYQQAQAGGADMAEAVRMADKAIRQTQTKHTAKDLAQAEGGYMRPLMMFAGPLVIINNRLQEAGLRGLRGDVRNWTQALGVWIAMAAGGAWVFELIMGRGPGDEDDDGDEDAADWLRWSAEKLALLPFSAFPILREIGSYVESGFVRANPLVEAGKSVAQFGEANIDAVFGDEEFDPEAYAKKAIRAAGVVTGIPTNQLLRSGEYLMAVGAGEHVPENPAAEAYYLMQGPPDDE